MTKLEVTPSQFDEIEAIVRHNPGGQEWVDANLTLMPNNTVYPIDEVVYVFFGPLANMLQWKRDTNVEFDPKTFSVRHAFDYGRLQGSRAKPKRVFDIDGSKDWYNENYYNPDVQQTLHEIYRLEASYGRAD